MSRVITENAGALAASTEAFAFYVIVAGFGRAPKTFPKRAHKRACSRLVRIVAIHFRDFEEDNYSYRLQNL